MEMSPELKPIVDMARNAPLADKMVHTLGRPVKTEGEIRPTDIAPVIAPNAKGVRTVFPMIWGFTLPDRENTKRAAPLINARVETAAVKPTFKESWAHRRCIVPASYYFEWEHLTRPDGIKKTGDKYVIQPVGATTVFFAGLYRMENGFPCFTILTGEPSQDISHIHDRMPIMLPQDVIDRWICPNGRPDEVIKHALTDMIAQKSV